MTQGALPVITLETSDPKSMQAWQSFVHVNNLTEHQATQFKVYLQELLGWNEKINLTSIETIKGALDYHFQDSLMLGQFVALSGNTTLCDVGSGGGFPGIPLKIKYPETRVILLEVNSKKIAFLEHIITLLELRDIEVCSYDWRSFLRKGLYPDIAYFCARASLKPEDLSKLFQPGYVNKNATLVYWAAKDWEPVGPEIPYIYRQEGYKTGSKSRKLVFMKKVV